MKFAIICLAILGIFIPESMSMPGPEDAGPELEAPQNVQRKPFGQPLIIQRLLRYPIGVLKIALGKPNEEKMKPDILPKVWVPPENETTEEVPVTEEDWQPLQLNETDTVLKSLITAPTRCKDGQGLVGGRCREVF